MREGTMPFCWEEDPRAEAEGVVLAVDVTRHARRAGLESVTFMSRGVWLRFIGAGPDQERRLLDTLSAAAVSMSNPIKASDDGTAVLFALTTGGEAARDVISIIDAERGSLTFMLWPEFARRPTGPTLRVRIVAEDDDRARA